MQQQFRNFMSGRYGADQLSKAMAILAIAFSLIAMLLNSSLFSAIGTILFILSIFRIFSKDIASRARENHKYRTWVKPLKQKWTKLKHRIKGGKTHKYISCPDCSMQMRVPRGKGKMNVTCPKCNTKFMTKT